MAKAGFNAAEHATRADWLIIEAAEARWRGSHGVADGLLRLLASLERDDNLGAPVNLFTHCVQTASRALRDGADDELIVVALFHDMPEAISENDHGRVAAQLLAPRLSQARAWLLIHHAAFQNAYFANHPTRSAADREALLDHPYAAQTDYFCRNYDQNSFDAHYAALTLEEFRPIVRRYFSAQGALA